MYKSCLLYYLELHNGCTEFRGCEGNSNGCSTIDSSYRLERREREKERERERERERDRDRGEGGRWREGEIVGEGITHQTLN